MKKTIIRVLSLLVLAIGASVSLAIVHAAGTSAASRSASQIAFPVTELGNCASVAECKKYCDQPAHITACVAVAEKNGMLTPAEAEAARNFADVLKGEGPGKCQDKEACEAYCNNSEHIPECVGFAEKHNLIPPDQLAQAKKVTRALAAGAKLPGGCSGKESCDAYCGQPDHLEECLNFAEQAGFISPAELAQAKKVLPLIKDGKSPGRCQTKDTCEKYCADDAHLTECVNFAETAGLMSKDEAEMVRKVGGRGPGGCRSKEACDAYCNQAENQNACFEFAQKYNLIPEDKLKEIKDGMGRLRSGMKQMPPEVVACLKDKLGEDAFTKVEAGTLAPGSQLGDTIKDCLDQFTPEIKKKVSAAFKMADAETLKCLEDKLGAEGVAKLKAGEAPTPEMGDTMKQCFTNMQTQGLTKMREGLGKMPPEMRGCVEEKLGAETVAKIERGEKVELSPETGDAIQGCAKNVQAAMRGKMEEGLKQAPPEIQDCLRQKLGNIEEQAQSGAIRSVEDVQPLIQECLKNFRPSMPAGKIPPAGYTPPGVPKAGDTGAPPGVPQGTPPADFQPTPDICAKFSMAPSCDYVPESMRDTCRKCLSR